MNESMNKLFHNTNTLKKKLKKALMSVIECNINMCTFFA